MQVAVKGKAAYPGEGKDDFTWDHAWVAYDSVVVDGNVDSMTENPMVPDEVHPQCYWGPVADASGRKLATSTSPLSPTESDDEDHRIWWPELEAWLRDMGFVS